MAFMLPDRRTCTVPITGMLRCNIGRTLPEGQTAKN
jgi:hypothetical protein